MALATAYFWVIDPRQSRARKGFWALALLFQVCRSLGLAAEPAHRPDSAPAPEITPAASAKKAYSEALAHYKKKPGDPASPWQFARACFDLAEFASDGAERAEIAEQGIAACRELIARNSKSAPAHYYLGMDMGQVARTKGIGALKLVSQMEDEFTVARDLDEHFDYAGPDRNLGLLYRDAPSVGSVGSRSKARKHLQRAAELAPSYPDNGLNLIETYLKWSDRNGARRELKALEAAWPAAKKDLTGSAWTASWTDWDQRLAKVKKAIEQPAKGIEAPRQRD